MAVRIEGIDTALKVFDNQPQAAKKVSDTAMRAGVRAGVRAMKQGAPPRFRDLVKGKVGKDADLDTWASVGYYNTHVARGHQPKAYQGEKAKDGISDWFKFYWNNYGTLMRRDHSHKFVFPVKGNVKKRRNAIGIAPKNWFEQSYRLTIEKFREAYESSVNKNVDKLIQR